ncbi:MAG: cation:proton antiporter, partial [Candidatus Ventricola sp.]
LLSISIALCAGLLVSRFVKPLKMPAVTGYLIAGILIGPYCLGRLGVTGLGFTSMTEVKALSLFNDVALGFIAFAIGNEFRLSQLKKTGRQATVIGIFQALVAALLVDVVLIALHEFVLGDKLPLADAITLGAIATATAPAATLMVVRQYKAKGKLTDLLLPIVALDDAVGLIVFSVSFGIAKALNLGMFDLTSILLEPILEIIASLLLGLIMGIIFSAVEKYFKSNSKRLSLSITFVILTVALSMTEFTIGTVKVGFSSLLVCMMLGTVFCNVCDFSEEIMGKTDRWTAPLFILFFVLSGAELELNVLGDAAIVGIGLAYIITRSLGKYLGAFISAKAVHCEPLIQHYLGITLMPQAGVALGMSVTVAQTLGAGGQMVRNIVLFGVLIYELVGPTLTRIALTKSGDITPRVEPAAASDD